MIAGLFDELFEQAFALAAPETAFELMRDYVNKNTPVSRITGISKTPTVSSASEA